MNTYLIVFVGKLCNNESGIQLIMFQITTGMRGFLHLMKEAK